MVLYKVMVVDDEEELCKEMIKKLPWKALGFEIVGTAGNGLKALDRLKKQQPEVIITDIHMPFMDGIDFLEQALKIVPRTKTIVLSHCDEFEYAQRAISLHVSDYILKPFSFSRLIETLNQLKKSLDDEREEEQKNKKIGQQYEEMLPTLKENFLINCLTGNLTAEGNQEKAESLNVGFESALYIVGLICIKQSGNHRTNPASYFEKKKELLTVKRVAEQILSQFYSIETLVFGEHIVVLVPLMTKQETGSLLNRMNDVCRESQKQVDADVMAGVGNVYERLEDSTFSYKEALDALNYNHLLNEKESLTIYAKNIRKEKRTYSVLTKAKGQLLESAIRFGNRESVTKCIKELFEVIVEQNFSMNQYQLYYFGIVTTLMHIMADHAVEMNAAVEESIVYIDDLGNHSLKETQESIERLSHKLSDSIQMEYIDSSKAIICKAKRFIEAEFADADLSVEKISKKLYISSTYFSTLFKKETSKSFITYLTDVRLEQALRLLETTENKSYQIAEKVGYPEANYFSYVFKKKFGMSPTNYRKQVNTQLV